MKRRSMLAIVAVVMAAAGSSVGSSRPAAESIGLARILNAHHATDMVRGIATFDAVPTARETSRLRALGLTVQPMRRLPLALVRGPVSALKAAVARGGALDVYLDERLQYFDQASADAMGAAAVRARGLTGKGVTVAVVDSGCDASHPDLADHVVHNVKLYSAEYVNLRPDSSNTIAVPVELLPYSNSDIGSGHGTHVAGIIAADGTTDPTHVGVAPDANLVCLAIGEVIFTTAVVTAYDFLLDQPNMWDVDVINNSWGNSFQMFDPAHPVHVATRAVADLGVVVAFAAGNRGPAEASINPFSVAPWVISVANGTLKHGRSNSSSNGLHYDNSRPFNRAPGGRTFWNWQVGIDHPDVTAPGSSISSSCDTAGNPVVVGPCPPGQNTSASGTSMASPHVAGAAAVLLQANPRLTPTQIRDALQITATPMYADPDAKLRRLGFWQVGYGFIDLEAAVKLATRRDFAAAIGFHQQKREAAMRKNTSFAYPQTQMWTWDAPPLALGGSDVRVFQSWVMPPTTHLNVTVSHPSLAAVGVNGMAWSATVRDAMGKVLGTTTEALEGAGTASIRLDLRALQASFGLFEITVSGDMAVSDPDTIDSESALGRVVVLHLAHLQPKPRG